MDISHNGVNKIEDVEDFNKAKIISNFLYLKTKSD